MARRIVSNTTLTWTAVADSTNIPSGTFPFLIQGGSGTQLNKIWEVSIAGQAASSSSPLIALLSRDTQVGTGANSNGTGTTDTAIDPATAALSAPALTGNIFATNLPQRSATAHLANCSLNAFGGVYFWRANRLEECFSVLGNTQPLGEASLSAFTGGTPGLVGSHMIYESL